MNTKTVMLSLLKVFALLSVMGYLGFALAKLSRPTGEMVCTGVDIAFEDSTANLLLTHDDVRHLLMAHKLSPKGMRYSDINTREIDSLLSQSPYIDTVTTYRTSAGMLMADDATIKAESEEELKNLLMKVKEESKKKLA